MSDNLSENFLPENKKPWHHTAGGIIFLFFISLIILGAVGFMALFSYYAWQIKYGSLATVEKINQSFTSSKFTVGTKLTQNKSTTDPSISNLADYVRDYNPVFGNLEAKITVLAFLDFECPYSQQAYSDFSKFLNKYEPIVKVVFKNLPLQEIHPNATSAHASAMCALAQNKFWSYYNLLFTQKKLDQDSLLLYAQNLNLNKDKFQSCITSEKIQTELETDLSDAVKLGVIGSPTYFVNNVKIEGVLTLEEWDKVILNFLKNN
ncbi:MAG TPA: hypothetical protein DEB09_05105 [Candidatus Magasanikbacteria bacterium]|nr:hypothetical protein [Candidatus Magasanikbacteria bacterium]